MTFNQAIEEMRNGNGVRLPWWHEDICWRMDSDTRVFEYFKGKKTTLIDSIKLADLDTENWVTTSPEVFDIGNLLVEPNDNKKQYYHIAIRNPHVTNGTTLTLKQMEQLYKYLHKILDTEED